MSRVCRCLSRKKVTPSLEDGFSPVGIPAEAQPRSAFEAKVPEETEPCPGCGTIYTPNANYCAHCGRRRGEAPKESSPSPVSEVKQSASPLPTSSPARENLPAKAPAPAAAPAPADNESTSRQATLPTAKAEAAPISTPKPSTPSVPSEPSAIPAGKEGNYVVELRREKPTDRYGFAWDANSVEKQNLRVINKILPGTLAAVWNASAPPGCDIRSGDMLVKVNGREGRLELMTVELSKQHVVCEFQPKEARVFGGAVKDVALPEASSAVTPSVPKVPPAKSAMEQPQVALPEASSAVTPSVPKVPPAKSAMEQPQVALPEASSAVTPSVPKVPPAKSAMEQPQVALPEASSAVTPFVPKVPPAKSAMEQPQVALPEASSAVTPSVPKAPPKSTMEQPKVTVQILEDSDSSSSSELEDKTPPSASTAQASHVAQPVTSSSSCLTVGTERPPELDHPSLEVVDQADVPTKAHREEVRAKAASLQKPEVETERTERECIVDLERGAVSEKWGFQWDREAMDRQQQRVISAVAPNSLAEDWNRRFPGRAVRKGYRLVKVNGVEDYGGIAAELKKKQITCHFEAGH